MSRNSKSPRTRWLRAGVRLCCVLLALPACLPPKLQALSGMEGTFEFACDAPWRMEPTRNPDGTFSYGAIPIQISIHDAREAADDNIIDHFYFSSVGGGIEQVKLPANLTSLGHFRAVHIRQLAPAAGAVALYDLSAFHEIEMTVGAWPWPADAAHPPPTRMLCRGWAGDDPEPFRDLRSTSEWHGSLWYQPPLAAAGTTITLEIEVILERDPWSEPRGPLSGQVIHLPVNSQLITLKNYVRVHLATEPLPRFDRRWLYGDFHYHSQGTDNEGESAYNYRGVVRAMGAMGLDFLFATEHASSSEQLRDLDLNIDLMEEFFGKIGGDVDALEESDTDQSWGILRDMDARRYAACHGMIYGDRGVNREATLRGSNGALPQNYLSHGSVPQIFLGGELDVVPEVKLGTAGAPPPPPPGPPPLTDIVAYSQWLQRKRAYDSWQPTAYPYGNGLSYDLDDLRHPGNQPPAKLYEATGDAILVHDFQALDRYDLYGREHLVYFPASADLYTDSGESTFIPSYTSKYGGATRRLDAAHQNQAPMLPEIERKGVAFVAHHLNGGTGGRGPDGSPWTLDHMLQKAFRSPAILGLEFWNEDTRYQSRVCSHEFCRDDGYLGQERGYERDEYFSLFGIQPDELTDAPLALPEVRHGFVSGNSAGGLFELKSFSLPDGRWESASYGTEHALHHGAFDWDKLNLLGLDFEGRPALSWLEANEPRRVFMGGGSDAHGDFNHRRAGYFLGTDDANDTAIGKPRNLVLAGNPEGPIIYDARPVNEDVRADGAGGVPNPGIDPGLIIDPVLDPVLRTPDPVIDPALLAAEPVVEPALPFAAAALRDLIDTRPTYPVIRAHTQEQIIRALRAGHFCVTDGPAIRMAIDMNGNNQIDDEDVPMGDVYRFHKDLAQLRIAGHQAVTVLTECISTPEFGPIAKVHLYVGVQPGSGRAGEARVYAPADHAVRDASRAPSSRLVETYISQGQAYSRMEDGYWFAPELTLLPSAGDLYTFTAATTIDLGHYEAGKGISADRFFVRAFVETGGNEAAQLPPRYGFTNPIWLLRSINWWNELPVVINPIVRPPARPAVAIERNVTGLTIEFTGILQHAASLDQPFEDVPGAVSPYPVPFSRKASFFRARN